METAVCPATHGQRCPARLVASRCCATSWKASPHTCTRSFSGSCRLWFKKQTLADVPRTTEASHEHVSRRGWFCTYPLHAYHFLQEAAYQQKPGHHSSRVRLRVQHWLSTAASHLLHIGPSTRILHTGGVSLLLRNLSLICSLTILIG